jgi:C4-dicarboxylate transporter DctQ subunit
MDYGKAVAIGYWLRKRAENVAAFLLATMFICFLIQIAMRYVFNNPVGWTEETSILAWIWGVLWGSVLVLREKDEVRFDIIYSAVSERTRRIFTIITGSALVILYSISLPGVFSYITFMKVEKSAYLGIRFDYLFSIYLLFVTAAIIRYAFLTWRAIRGRAPEIELGSGSAL